MTRPILQWPDKRLRKACDPVDKITDADRATWDAMIEVMEAMPGVGLGANQIGYLRALAVVDASGERGQAIRMANPRVLHSSAKMNEHDEASPCLPGVSARITRPRAVTVEFMDADGALRQQDFVGLWATSVQHQIDHLSGKMYFDHLSRTKRAMLVKKAAKR